MMRPRWRYIKKCLNCKQSPEGLATGANPMGKHQVFWQSCPNFVRPRRFSWPNPFTSKMVAINAAQDVAF